jgi:hypothetical protein
MVQLVGLSFALGEERVRELRGARRDGEREDRRYLEQMRARQISLSSPVDETWSVVYQGVCPR